MISLNACKLTQTTMVILKKKKKNYVALFYIALLFISNHLSTLIYVILFLNKLAISHVYGF